MRRRNRPRAERKENISEAERFLRRRLAFLKVIRSESDDRGLYNWLRGMVSAQEDPRSEWEKQLTDRLADELGIAA